MEEERTIDLKHMLYTVCKGWRRILIWMLVFGVLFTGIAVVMSLTQPELSEKNDKIIAEAAENLTQQELEEVDRALVSAKQYVDQRDSILEYLNNSYMVKNVMGEVPVNQFRYLFKRAMIPSIGFDYMLEKADVPSVQYSYLFEKAKVPVNRFSFQVEQATVPVNQYSFLVEKEDVQINQYRFSIEKAMKPSINFRFYVDNHYVSSGDNVLRDNLEDITFAMAAGLNDISVTRDVLTLIGANMEEDQISRYVNAWVTNGSYVTLKIWNMELTEEQEKKVTDYLEKTVQSFMSDGEKSYGSFDVVLNAVTRDVSADPIQPQMKQVIAGIASALTDKEALTEMAAVLGISDKKNVEKYFIVRSDDFGIDVSVSNVTITEEQNNTFISLLQTMIANAMEAQKVALGENKATYMGKTTTIDTDPLQTKLDEVSRGIVADMNSAEVVKAICAKLGISDSEKYAKNVRTHTDGSRINIVVKNIEVSESQNKALEQYVCEKVIESAGKQKDTLGNSKITYLGSADSVEEDTLQKMLSKVTRGLQEVFATTDVVNEMAQIAGIDEKKATDYFRTQVQENQLTVILSNVQLNEEDRGALETYIRKQVMSAVETKKEEWGDSAVTYLGAIQTQEEDWTQTKLNNVVQNVADHLNSLSVLNELANILKLDNTEEVNKRIRVNTNEAILNFSVDNWTLSEQQDIALREYLLSEIYTYTETQKLLLGDSLVTFMGRNETLKADGQQQDQLLKLAVEHVKSKDVLSELGKKVGLTEEEKINRYISVGQNGPVISVLISGVELDREKEEELTAYLMSELKSITARYEQELGGCKINTLGCRESVVEDTTQVYLQEIMKNITVAMNDQKISASIATVLEANPSYMAECLSAQVDGNYVQAEVSYLQMTEEQKNIVNGLFLNAIEGLHSSQQDLYGDYTVEASAWTTKTVINTAGASIQLNYTNTLNSINSNYRNLANNMSAEQKELFAIRRNRQEQYDEVTEKDGVSKKLIVLGALLGMVFGVGIGAVSYLMNGMVKTEDDFSDIQIDVLGALQVDHGTLKGPDRWVERLFNKRTPRMSEEESVEIVLARLLAFTNGNHVHSLCLIGSSDDKNCLLLKRLADELRMSVENVSITNSFLTDVAMNQRIHKCDAVVYVKTVMQSNWKDLVEEHKLVRLNGVQHEGALLVR